MALGPLLSALHRAPRVELHAEGGGGRGLASRPLQNLKAIIFTRHPDSMFCPTAVSPSSFALTPAVLSFRFSSLFSSRPSS